jgi:hypothetical protein
MIADQMISSLIAIQDLEGVEERVARGRLESRPGDAHIGAKQASEQREVAIIDGSRVGLRECQRIAECNELQHF